MTLSKRVSNLEKKVNGFATSFTTETLNVTSSSTVTGISTVTGNTNVSGNLIVSDNIDTDTLTANSTSTNTAITNQTFTLNYNGSNANAIGSGIVVAGTANLNYANIVIGGSGNWQLKSTDGNINTLDALVVNGTLAATGATTLTNTLGVNGATTLSSTLNVIGGTTLSTLSTSGTATLGAATIVNNLGVNGATTLSSTLNVAGLTTLGNANVTTANVTNLTATNLTATNILSLSLPQSSSAPSTNGYINWYANVLTVGTGVGTKSFVDTDSVQSLSNKTLTSPSITSPTITGLTSLNTTNLTVSNSGTVGNLTVSGNLIIPTSSPLLNGIAINSSQLSANISGTVLTYVDTTTSQSLSNKTLNSPFINSGTVNGTLNVPANLNISSGSLTLPSSPSPSLSSTGQVAVNTSSNVLQSYYGSAVRTLVDTNSTQTLSNKTISNLILSGSVPGTSTSSGTTGQIAFDTNYIYICVSNNNWRRAALSTW